MYPPEEWHGYFWQGHAHSWSRNLVHTPPSRTRTKNFNANCLWWRNGHEMFASLMISILIMLCWSVRTVSYFIRGLFKWPSPVWNSSPRLIAINNITARSPQSQWKMVIRLSASSHERSWPGWPSYRDEFRLGFIWEFWARFRRWEEVKNTGDEFWRQNRETK